MESAERRDPTDVLSPRKAAAEPHPAEGVAVVDAAQLKSLRAEVRGLREEFAGQLRRAAAANEASVERVSQHEREMALKLQSGFTYLESQLHVQEDHLAQALEAARKERAELRSVVGGQGAPRPSQGQNVGDADDWEQTVTDRLAGLEHFRAQVDDVPSSISKLSTILSVEQESRAALEARLSAVEADIGKVHGSTQGHQDGVIDILQKDCAAAEQARAMSDRSMRDMSATIQLLKTQLDDVSAAQPITSSGRVEDVAKQAQRAEELAAQLRLEVEQLRRDTEEDHERVKAWSQEQLRKYREEHMEPIKAVIANLPKGARSDQDIDILHAKHKAHEGHVSRQLERVALENKEHFGDRLDKATKEHQADVSSRLEKVTKEHQDFHAGLHGALDEHKTWLERQLSQEKRQRDEHGSDIHMKVDGLDSKMRRDMARISSEHGERHAKLADVIDQNRIRLDRVLAVEKDERDNLQVAYEGQMKDLDRALRKELSQSSGEFDNVLCRVRDMLQDHKAESKSVTQSHITELDGEIRSELFRMASEHNKKLTQLQEVCDDIQTGLEMQIAAERASREEHRSMLQVNIADLETQVRREVARMTAEHQEANNHMRDLLTEQKLASDRGFGGERAARDELKSSILNAVEMLNTELRREIQRNSDVQSESSAKVLGLLEQQTEDFRRSLHAALQSMDVEIRKAIARLADEHAGKHATNEQALEELDAALRSEMLRLNEDTHNTSLEFLEQSTSTTRTLHAAALGELEAKFLELLAQLDTGVQGQLRSLPLGDLQARLVSLSKAALADHERIELVERSLLEIEPPRVPPDFEPDIQRLWQALDSHSHPQPEPRRPPIDYEPEIRRLWQALETHAHPEPPEHHRRVIHEEKILTRELPPLVSEVIVHEPVTVGIVPFPVHRAGVMSTPVRRLSSGSISISKTLPAKAVSQSACVRPVSPLSRRHSTALTAAPAAVSVPATATPAVVAVPAVTAISPRPGSVGASWRLMGTTTGSRVVQTEVDIITIQDD